VDLAFSQGYNRENTAPVLVIGHSGWMKNSGSKWAFSNLYLNILAHSSKKRE
jgi:hypothetical protein